MKLISKVPLILFLCLKIKWLLVAIVWQESPPKCFDNFTTHFDEQFDATHFQIMDKAGVMFSITPKLPDSDFDVVAMVLSAPGNFKQRSNIREEIQSHQGVVAIFLLAKANNSYVEEKISEESMTYNDIVQISIQDGYEYLSYKSFSGFLWINKYAGSAKFVVKIDDDVSIFWHTLRAELKRKYRNGIHDNVIECPSVMRNMPPWRPRISNHARDSIMGKWAVTEEEMSRRVYPDFCPGWAYVISPKLGVKLAQAAASLREFTSMKRLDDIFVTGFARERLQGVKVEQIKGGLSGYLWNTYLSHCPFMGITKNVFFNDNVKTKGNYVNGFNFYFCAFLEYFILDTLDSVSPQSIPSFLNKICQR